MPFIEEKIGGFLQVQDTRETPRPEAGGMSTAAKLGTVGAIGVGLYAAPLLTLGGLAVGGAASLMADDEGRDAAFRTENTIGSFLSSESLGYDGKVDEAYDPWADIAGTEHEQYWDRFSRARNKEHADLIRADIEREKKDRQYLESQGMLGFAQSMAAGLFDLPSLLPGGAVVRTARGGTSVGRTALTVGAFGAGGAAITEGALQATQQLRTGEESAMNIAGATILSGVLGAGMASRMSRAELNVMGKRVEQEFGAPRVVGEDQPSPEITTSQPVDELEMQLRQVASEILPDSVRLDVVESLAAPKTGDDQFALRGYHGSPEEFTRFDRSRIGTGEGTADEGWGFYISSSKAEGAAYQQKLRPETITLNGKQIGDDEDLQFFVNAKLQGEDVFGMSIEQHVTAAEEVLERAKQTTGPRREQNIAEAEERLEKAKQVRDGDVKPGGSLYEVEIDADGQNFLNLFTTLGEQPEALASVQKAFDEAGLDSTGLASRQGQDAYFTLAEHLGSNRMASDALRKAGLAGNQYASYNATNYVVFDENLLKIRSKNGEPVSSAERQNAIDEMMGIRRDQAGPVAEGKFNRDELLITISRAALDPVGTLHHEAVHALRAIKLFTAREWKALTNAAKSKGWMDVPEIKDYQNIYGKPLEDDNIVEEAIAMAFQRHVSGAEIQRGVLGSVFQRLKNFLERIAGVLKGQGMNTADDVFKRIREGDVAARAEPTGQRGRATGRTTAGAASAQEGDIRLKGAFGTEKALAFLSPAMRLQNSPARESRRWLAELAETALSYKDHKDWIATARGGAEIGEPGSVETRVKLYDANIAAGFRALDNAFMEYRKGTQRRIPGDLTVTSLKDATIGAPQDKMDYRQFREAVSAAMRRGDAHEIPQVANAAKALRREVFDPLLQRAVELDMLPEGVTPETAPSYLNRMYNKERIVAERPEFKQVVAKWLQETEVHNQAIRGRLERHLEEFGTNEGKLKSLEKKISLREKRLAEIEKAGEEVSRFNKFATERSIKMSEPIDEIRTEINAITARIEEQLARIQNLSGEIRTQKENIPGLQDVERQMQALSRALSDVRKRTEFIEQIEDASSIDESLGKLATSFQDTLGRLRGEARELRSRSEQPDNLLPSGMTQEQMVYKASQEVTGDSLRIMLEDYSQGGVVKKHFPSGEKREVLDRMADDVREILSGIETGDRPRSVRAIGNALIEADALEKLHSGPEARLFTQWVRAAARNHRVEAAAERRIPYPEISGGGRASEAGQILKALENERARLSRRIGPFRRQIRTLRAEQRRLEKRARPRAAEGNVYGTKIRGRVNTMQDQISGRRGELDTLRTEQETRNNRINELRQLIEEQIEQYQGKSAKEAKAAIEARRQVEETRDPDAARLRSADKDVLKAAKRIADQVAKEEAELDTLADEIIDRILGTPEGRLPYDRHLVEKPGYGGVNMEARGPLAARQFMIPDKRIEPWLENDIDILMRAYVHTMAADTELTARFGSPDMVMQFKQINEEYAKLAANTDAAGRKKLHERKKNDFLDLGAIRDRIRGTYALPENPDGLMVRVARNLMTLNYMRMLGGMTISAIPDLHRFIAVNGVMRTFGDGLVPMFRNFKGYKKSGDEAKWLSGALEMVTDNRAMRIADITDTFGRHTRFERSVQAAGRNFGMVSLMAPWNAVMKQVAGTVTQTRILRSAERLFSGKTLKQRDIEYMADLGISEGALRMIGDQFKKHGHKEGGVWFANTAQWDQGSRMAIEALRVGLRKEVDRIIVTPSFGEKPRMASTLTGAMLLQFKSFAISATQKMLISGLQARDLNQVNGAALAIALGGLVHILKGYTSGRDVDVDWGDEDSVKQFMGNAFDRSGLAGVLMEFNNVAEKVTDGRVGLSAITGKPISRYASRNVTASLLGPGFGLAEDSFQALNAALGSRDWTARDTHNARQLLPYGNLFYLRSAFDKAEEGINEAFGVPAK